MDDLWKDNKFISFLYDYYFYCIEKHKYIYNKKLVPKYKYFPFIKKEIIDCIDETKDDKMMEKKTFIIKEFQDESYNMSFAQLWDFCKFIRYAEKIVFWKNKPDKCIYVDSELYEDKILKFSLKDNIICPSMECIFELEKIPTNGQQLEIIRLSIVRQYGKLMTNTFTIVNADVKYNDSSDILLITTINRILRQQAINTFEDILVHTNILLE